MEGLLPGGAGKRGRRAQDNRRFINAVSWIFRTGAPCSDVPPEYGDWKNTHRRFCHWRDRDVWKSIAAEVIGEVDTGWLMIDVTY
ncbi:MAG: transposase, partial [Treponema sp.]|nr:transposase [Treponema sp.]